MTIPSTHCEARLKGISKKHDKGGDWAQITLQVAPEDLPDALWQAPLGTIFMVAFARVGDDGEPVNQESEKPTRPGRSFASLPRSQQAGILCNDETFQKWVVANHGYVMTPGGEAYEFLENPISARTFVIDECKVNSRRELDVSDEAGVLWDALRAQFETATGRATEARG